MSLKFKPGDTFWTEKGFFVITEDGLPQPVEYRYGTHGGILKTAMEVKHNSGKQVLLIAQVCDYSLQPKNNCVKVQVEKERYGTPGECCQTIMLHANTIVEVDFKCIGLNKKMNLEKDCD